MVQGEILMKKYRVKEMAALAGITPQTLRRYEKLGIFSPGRNEDNQYRWYSSKDLVLLLRLRSLRGYGFGLQESCDVYRKQIDDAIGIYEAHEEELERQAEQLRWIQKQAAAQRERLQRWKELSRVPFETVERPEAVMFLYRDEKGMIDEEGIAEKLPEVLQYMPPLRSGSVRRRMDFLQGRTRYQGGVFAFVHEFGDANALEALEKLGCIRLPACRCLMVAVDGLGRMCYRAEKGRSLNEQRVDLIQRLLVESGSNLSGDILGEVLHMSLLPENDEIPMEDNLQHYDFLWIPI